MAKLNRVVARLVSYSSAQPPALDKELLALHRLMKKTAVTFKEPIDGFGASLPWPQTHPTLDTSRLVAKDLRVVMRECSKFLVQSLSVNFPDTKLTEFNNPTFDKSVYGTNGVIGWFNIRVTPDVNLMLTFNIQLDSGGSYVGTDVNHNLGSFHEYFNFSATATPLAQAFAALQKGILASIAKPKKGKDIAKLAGLVHKWFYDLSTDLNAKQANFDKLGAELEVALQELKLYPNKGAKDRIMYRAIDMPLPKVQAALASGKLTLQPREYSSWATDLKRISRYSHSVGVVVAHRIAPSAQLLDLSAFQRHLERTISGLNARNFQYLSEEDEVIVKQAPTQCLVVGVVASDGTRLNKVALALDPDGDDANVIWDDSDSGGVFLARKLFLDQTLRIK